jgi:23S rRNA pseudouridine2457 synthase
MMEHHYFALNKPQKVISQFIRFKKGKKRMLGDLYDFPEGTMAVGRLDENSEGLLLLTTNGKESNRISTGGIEKEYYAQVDGDISEASIQQMKEGVEIGIKGVRYMTKSCEVRKLTEDPGFDPPVKKIRGEHHGPTSWVSIIIKEGKFRQVRKMTGAVGNGTLRLVRVRIGDIKLGSLKSGEVKVLDLFKT